MRCVPLGIFVSSSADCYLFGSILEYRDSVFDEESVFSMNLVGFPAFRKMCRFYYKCVPELDIALKKPMLTPKFS